MVTGFTESGFLIFVNVKVIEELVDLLEDEGKLFKVIFIAEVSRYCEKVLN